MKIQSRKRKPTFGENDKVFDWVPGPRTDSCSPAKAITNSITHDAHTGNRWNWLLHPNMPISHMLSHSQSHRCPWTWVVVSPVIRVWTRLRVCCLLMSWLPAAAAARGRRRHPSPRLRPCLRPCARATTSGWRRSSVLRAASRGNARCRRLCTPLRRAPRRGPQTRCELPP